MTEEQETKLTSTDLKRIQDTLDSKIRKQLKKPDCDYGMISVFSELAGKVETLRRKAWHEEKFGIYEQMAEEIIEQQFAADDIPF